MHARVIVALLATGCACGDDPRGLAVDVRTDLAPGVEIAGVRVEVARAGRDLRRVRDLPVYRGDALVDGVRVAEIADTGAASVTLRVALVDDAGREVLDRISIVDTPAGRTTLVTVVLTRDCRGVTCPGPTDDPSASTCLGGRCIDPRCTSETPELCPAAECDSDAVCEAAVACAVGRCSEGACTFADRGTCAAAEWCDPDVGCRALSVSGDAGVVDAGSADAGPPAVERARVWRLRAQSAEDHSAVPRVAVAPDGRTFVAGTLEPGTDICGTPRAGRRDAFVAEAVFGAPGTVADACAGGWIRVVGSAGEDDLRDLHYWRSSDGAEEALFVVGAYSESGPTGLGGDCGPITDGQGYLMRLTTSGELVWCHPWGYFGPYDSADAVTSRGDTIIFTGTFGGDGGAPDFFNSTGWIAAFPPVPAVVDGFLDDEWFAAFGGPWIQWPRALAVAGDTVVVAGIHGGPDPVTTDFGGGRTVGPTTGLDAFAAGYGATDGALRWATAIPAPSSTCLEDDRPVLAVAGADVVVAQLHAGTSIFAPGCVAPARLSETTLHGADGRVVGAAREVVRGSGLLLGGAARVGAATFFAGGFTLDWPLAPCPMPGTCGRDDADGLAVRSDLGWWLRSGGTAPDQLTDLAGDGATSTFAGFASGPSVQLSTPDGARTLFPAAVREPVLIAIDAP